MTSIQMRDDFAIFILTHGRADNVYTMRSLAKTDYNGRIVILVDDTDKQIEQYKKNFGDMVYVFDKEEAYAMTDVGDNFRNMKQILYARNICWKVAEELGIRYFIQFDDDYSAFTYTFDNQRNYISKNLHKNFTRVLNAMLNFYIESGFDTVCMSQGGDFMGGDNSTVAKKYKQGKFHRKAMNSFICSTDRPFKFLGGMNEDVNTYVAEQLNGNLKMMTYARARLAQHETQTNKGGMTDIYKANGTYVKSFYSVMRAPSCVQIQEMGVTNRRLHHSIKWANAVPEILSEDFKK